MKYCAKCGNPMEDDMMFCQKCGTKFEGVIASAQTGIEAKIARGSWRQPAQGKYSACKCTYL